METERDSANQILQEISDKVNALKTDYEAQKAATYTLQGESDALRQVYRAKQEESFQLNKSLEIREIQISSFKQELERTTSDISQQSASIAEFEKKTVILNEEIQQKNSYLEKLKREEEDYRLRITSTEKPLSWFAKRWPRPAVS